VEYAFSQVTTAKRLLRETPSSVGQNILHLFQFSIKNGECLPERLWLPLSSLIPSYFCFYNTHLGVSWVCPCRRWT
jgi:hypothetical protein